jgi:hypothetical protein
MKSSSWHLIPYYLFVNGITEDITALDNGIPITL